MKPSKLWDWALKSRISVIAASSKQRTPVLSSKLLLCSICLMASRANSLKPKCQVFSLNNFLSVSGYGKGSMRDFIRYQYVVILLILRRRQSINHSAIYLIDLPFFSLDRLRISSTVLLSFNKKRNL